MLQAVTHVGVGRQVDDRVAAPHCVSQSVKIEDIALDQCRTAVEGAVEKLTPARAQVVVDDDLAAALQQGIDEVRADEARTPGDQHAGQRHRAKPAAAASRWNILTVSRENSCRSRPRPGSFASSSFGHGDDVAADVAGLHDVVDLARTGPDEFSAGSCPHDLQRLPA